MFVPVLLSSSSGIYRKKDCALKPRDLDHAVLLVGYGTDKETGLDYWVVKNSWSKYWGDDGYFKVKRGGNDCGIASDAAFAVLADGYAKDLRAEGMGVVAAARAAAMGAMRVRVEEGAVAAA